MLDLTSRDARTRTHADCRARRPRRRRDRRGRSSSARAARHESTCPYCGVGCGVIVESDAGADHRRARRSRASGQLRPAVHQGQHAAPDRAAPVTRQTRLLRPQLRAARGEPPSRRLGRGAGRSPPTASPRRSRAHGPDAVGFYISGQLLTEDYYVFNKLAKGLIGTNNVDTNSRLCMISAVAGYKQTLGADAPPCCYEDLDHAATLFIAGSNTAFAHPILFRRIEDARARNPALKIIVADPRRTDTARGRRPVPADPARHRRRAVQRHAARDAVGRLARRALHRGPHRRLRGAQGDGARLHAEGRRASSAASPRTTWCRPRAGSASRRPTAVAVLPGPEPEQQRHREECRADQPAPGDRPDRQARRRPVLADRPAQCDGRARGRRHGQPAVGHRDLANAAHRAEVAALWGVDDVPAKPGKTAVEMFEAAADGEIKALWIACTNPAQSMPDQAMVRAALERANSSSCRKRSRHRHLRLSPTCCCPPPPGARRTARSPTPSAASPACVPAVAAAGRGARRLGDRHRLRAAARSAAAAGRSATLFPYANAESVWNEHRETTRGRDLDITGLSYAMLERGARTMAVRPRARATAARGCTKTASSRPPTAGRASPTPPTRRRPSRATRATRSRSTPAACATNGTA